MPLSTILIILLIILLLGGFSGRFGATVTASAMGVSALSARSL